MKLIFTIKYTLFEAYKRKLWLISGFLILACLAVGVFAASISITEGSAAYYGFYAGLLRTGGILLLSAYIIVTESRILEEQAGPLILAHAISRSEYFLGKWIAYGLVGLLISVVAIIPLFPFVEIKVVLIWAFALVCEWQIAIGVSLLLVLICKQPVSAMGLFAVFFLFARVSTNLSAHTTKMLSDETLTLASTLIAWLIRIACYLVPALDQYAYTARLIYPAARYTSILYISGEALIYSVLIVLLSLHRIRRRAF